MSTKGMPLDVKGAYIDLLAHSWANGPLPDDIPTLAAILGVTKRVFQSIWDVLSRRWKLTKRGWINRRLEECRREMRRYRKKQAEKGRKSAAKRANHGSNHGSTPVGLRLQPEPNPTPAPAPTPAKKIKTVAADAAPTNALMGLFSEFHVAKFDTKPAFRVGKDAKLLADLWRSRDKNIDEIAGLMRDFFASKDPFIAQAGWTVGVFISQIGKLLTSRPIRPRSLGPIYTDWDEECKALHAGKCENRYQHELAKVPA